VIFQVICIRKVQISEATSVAVNATLYLTCIITHKISRWGE